MLSTDSGLATKFVKFIFTLIPVVRVLFVIVNLQIFKFLMTPSNRLHSSHHVVVNTWVVSSWMRVGASYSSAVVTKFARDIWMNV